MSGVLVAGLGGGERRDDGVALAVLEALREPGPGRAGAGDDDVDVVFVGDPMRLVDLWDGRDLVVVVDAIAGASGPGTLVVRDLDQLSPPAKGTTTTTHGFELSSVLRLSRALGQGPKRAVLVGVEGDDFAPGTEMSPAVLAAVPRAAACVARLAAGADLCA
jgi:hydrogenase maturation protease